MKAADGPAIENIHHQEWWLNGKRCRTDSDWENDGGPAITSNDHEEWWLNVPAIKSIEHEEWRINGLIHRLSCPALKRNA